MRKDICFRCSGEGTELVMYTSGVVEETFCGTCKGYKFEDMFVSNLSDPQTKHRVKRAIQKAVEAVEAYEKRNLSV